MHSQADLAESTLNTEDPSMHFTASQSHCLAQGILTKTAVDQS